MDRRFFLRLFGASAVGVALAPEQLIWRPLLGGQQAPVLLTLHDVAKEMARAIGARIGSVRSIPMNGNRGWKLGEEPDGIQLVDQLNIGMEPLTPGVPYHYDRHFEPAASQMANMIRQCQMTTMAPLSVPTDWDEMDAALVIDEASGVIVRALNLPNRPALEYEGIPKAYLRMDVLGAGRRL